MEGGPPSFPQTHRGSWYSGCQPENLDGLATGLSPSLARRSSLLACIVGSRGAGPTTPPHLAIKWFGLLPVRSPLLGESRLISSRRATEMFQFAHCPPSLPMCSAGGLQTSLWRGCPIRNLRAQCSHAAPPERFAGLRVLLRSSAPRHPPRTLCSLSSCRQNNKVISLLI